MLCILLYSMWTVVWYVGFCMLFRLLYGVWTIVMYVACCMVCGMF